MSRLLRWPCKSGNRRRCALGFFSSLSVLLASLHLAFAPPQRLPRVPSNRGLRGPVRNTPRLPSTRTLQALPPLLVPTLPCPARLLGLLGPVGFFVAGGLCSSLSHVIATPIDVVKTSQQAEEERKGKSCGMLAMALKLVHNHGPRRLLSGAGATFTGYFLHGAFKYGLFEIWKAVFQIQKVSLTMHIPVLCLCAFLAEMLATIVLCPAEAARIMLVADPTFVEPARLAWERFCRRERRGYLHGIHAILTMFGLNTWLALQQLKSEQGVWNGWFGALIPLLVKQCSYTVAKLVTYDVLSTSYQLWGLHPLVARVAAAFSAATAATLASQPADTVFTCISVAGGSGVCPLPLDDEDLWDDKPISVWKQMRDAAKRLGLFGLFSGWQTRIFQMTLIVVVQLLLYDTIRPRF